jgi:hypothetical protein
VFQGGIMKINLYYNSTKVKTVRIKDGAEWRDDYKVTIIGQKRYFGSNFITLILRPVKLLRSTDKSLDLNCIVYEGADIHE